MFQFRGGFVEKVLISSCLMGARVRYDGKAKTLDDQLLATWRAEGRLISLCPEMAAGLPTPRAPAEIAPGATAEAVLRGRGAIYDKDGLDMTADFVNGANLALEVAQESGCRFALLTDGSPSCGSTRVYSGDFNGQTHEGEGVVAARLRAGGVRVFAQHQLNDLARAIEEAENSGG
ncbi:DUF523 domain-containing protein [Gymnodinialimonas hymeniacidonis]|uniref:DUF523 domain-containing protein n=1 Tax=Gymnodinialimonas hymeniacidonis TaxID=3126508 RepID=UPI0034C66EBB